MAHTNTDLIEEDAADLQFPKESTTYTSLAKFVEKNEYCANCFSELVSQYILCEPCNVNICLQCFSSGAEFVNHKNDHDYRILATNFVLFENSDWTAEEELKLLDALISYSNWNLVACEFPSRTVSEIKEHYEYFYLDGCGHRLMPKFQMKDCTLFTDIIVPYRFKLTDSEEPPRFAFNSIGYQSLAGYNAARGEFECEYDKGAEELLSILKPIDLKNPQQELLTNLQRAVVDSYNRRLKERQRWKRIISSHGVLLQRKINSWLHRYDVSVTKPVYEKMLRFMQYCDPTKFMLILEGLHKVGELKLQIHRLIQLRRKGITTLSEGRMYLKLQQMHDENRKQLKLFRCSPQFSWRSGKTVNLAMLTKYPKKRNIFAPIDIVGMPGYEKLTEKEKGLCSNVRLVPATYLELKEILMAENRRAGSIKLQTARRLLKIDVNKTRKLYDFLVEEGYVIKPDH